MTRKTIKLLVTDLDNTLYDWVGYFAKAFRAQPRVPLVPIPRKIHKPDPRILHEICADFATAPEHALYVGDSLTRDIAMAQQLRMNAAWASYGLHHDPGDWETLVRVTHWTAEDVARVEATRARYKNVVPDVELAQFGDILAHFDFIGSASPSQPRSA